MTYILRWQQRFDSLQLAYRQLQRAMQAYIESPDDNLIEMAVVKAFEMTFELAWN
jgi:hypothetical protein